MPVQFTIIRLFNPGLKIGLEDVRNAWLLDGNDPIKLKTQVHRGILVYRLPGSGKRVSLGILRKGLIKVHIMIEKPNHKIPF